MRSAFQRFEYPWHNISTAKYAFVLSGNTNMLAFSIFLSDEVDTWQFPRVRHPPVILHSHGFKIFSPNISVSLLVRLRIHNHHFEEYLLPLLACYDLTHWGRAKMAASFLTTYSNAYSWMKICKFQFRLPWSVFPRGQLTILTHWFR